jgi:hypothetical protein
MIRDIGKFKLNGKKSILTAKDLANHNLSVQMGWIPLISDLQKLLQFKQAARDRVEELKRLYSDTGLKRRMRLGSWSKESVDTFSIESAFAALYTSQRKRFTTAISWGTVRWLPTTVPSVPLDSKEMLDACQALVLGANLRPEYLWNAIPWSWLIDYAANVGEYLTAHNNTVPAVATGVNVMTTTVTTSLWSRIDNRQGVKGGSGITMLTTKERAQPSATLSASLPFLNARKLSILGSLALQRMR